MADTTSSPYNPRIVADGQPAVHNDLGIKAQTTSIPVKRPMPCIVILVHGVNDVGEAYQSQEKGIITGLSKRLNRDDLYAHVWKNFVMEQSKDAQMKIGAPGRSPVIPFYWGYKPVTHDDWRADQYNYRSELLKFKNDAHLPYDAYQEDNPAKMSALGNDGKNTVKFQNDNFGNELDTVYAKGGGTFANATTSIPDMLGPGAGGIGVAAAGFMSLYHNHGDFTHPIYDNPHRIYQFFAAQRLADLIIQIRSEDMTKHDVINIVAHSQGTIITMLANMLVNQAKLAPVNCVILNHSPYSLENRDFENIQPGHQQTDYARQQTFKNFCHLMKTQYKGGEIADGDIQALEATGMLRKSSDNPLRKDARNRRNNNGKVYNYFCPNDGVVSLRNVQGFGWRGIPQKIAGEIDNLYQRVFFQHCWVGKSPDGKPFEPPELKENDFQPPTFTVTYDYCDVVINGEELPEPFEFNLQGVDNSVPYHYKVDSDSPDQAISYSAKAATLPEGGSVRYLLGKDDYPNMGNGHVLSASELKTLSNEKGYNFVQGIVSGSGNGRGDDRIMALVWNKTREELEKEWKETEPVGYSQHSSIVMSDKAPSHAMAFDLAIGQCKSFDYQQGKFWESLLHRADWRDPHNGNPNAREYYSSGRLPDGQTKSYMNKPDEILPKGDFPVINEYTNEVTLLPSRFPEIQKDKRIKNLQWDMPGAKTDLALK